MALRVLIERELLPGKEMELIELLTDLRSLAMKAPGYISGQTLYALDNPREVLVISTWRSLEEWQAWSSHPEREAIDKRIDSLLVEPSRHRVYSHL